MSRVRKKIRYDLYIELVFFTALIIILLLSSINIHIFNQPKKVLGVATADTTNNEEFWNNFLTEHPDYIPGWLEIGNSEKASQIDPNYIKP